MKQLLVFTMSPRQSKYEAGRVEEEAIKKGIPIKRVLYKDLSFEMGEGKTKVFLGAEEINENNTMGAWFRVAGTVSGRYVEGRNMFISLMQDRFKCGNAEGYLNWARMGKISQHALFVKNGIRVVPTRIFYTKDQVKEALAEMEKDFGWPIICKHEKGYQGKSVFKLDSKKELLKFLKDLDEIDLGLMLWQKYLPSRWDLRVIVIDGKMVGAMKRSANGEEFRSNFSLGGGVEEWQISEEDREIAEKVAEVSGLDYCGVDVMKDDEDKSYVLEVNRQCQFQGFEKATGINVAERVIEMFLE